jgi:hypothetical protein
MPVLLPVWWIFLGAMIEVKIYQSKHIIVM